MKTVNTFGILALSFGLFAASCGNSSQSNNETVDHSAHQTETPATSEAPAPATEPAGSAASASNEVVIESNDQMKYNLSEINVNAAEPVKLTLKHVGTMKKDVMGHNVVVLKAGADVAAFTTAAMNAKDTDYIPESKDVIAHTKVIGGGEQDAIEFTLPGPGTYDFICSFPGHAGIMKGKIIAQ
ncbi:MULTISPECIES: azurin [Sphingobacterium]|uniref:azurin n=1 Tax=Sphingobacterium TaxID=28453 RepID=UPI0021A65F10|nr:MULTISPECIES: azurin [Sphingobacterium]MCT1525224.1 azurin [Sphingobacterium hotanense]